MSIQFRAASIALAAALAAGCESPPPSQEPWSPRAEITGLANGHQEIALYLSSAQPRPTILLQCEKVLAEPQRDGVHLKLEGAVPSPNWGNPQMEAWFADTKYKGSGDPEANASWFPFVSEVEKTRRMYVMIDNGETGFCSLTSDSGAGFKWLRQSSDHRLQILTKGNG